jgi:hypothetical protein
VDTNLLRDLFVLRFLFLLGAFALALGIAGLIAAWRARTPRHSRGRQSTPRLQEDSIQGSKHHDSNNAF